METDQNTPQDPTTIDPESTNEKNKWGGLRPGQGRPKGTTTIYSKESVKKLQSLGFDPIEKLVEQYWKLQKMVDDMQEGRTRMSQMALSGFLQNQTNIMNTLMKYGYRQIPERQEQVIEDKKPLKIVFEGLSEESK